MDFVVATPSTSLGPMSHWRTSCTSPAPLEPTPITELSSGFTDKRTGLEIKVLREGLEALGGRLKWIFPANGSTPTHLTKETTRQLLADRLWYGRIKLSWDPNYFAAKKKKLADRIASRDEFSKP